MCDDYHIRVVMAMSFLRKGTFFLDADDLVAAYQCPNTTPAWTYHRPKSGMLTGETAKNLELSFICSQIRGAATV